ncbi:hypothetical protein PGT21_017684 [Puccinia graminis f. sp. tritici]|uniref:Uncharacterized protein n=1 Tax=Puccinia graminis f. sp. tritici TaxID=56615 RepID=A0A5B0PCY8_PUCGR|nr:hypothetical protein PGT21_017684 [Puccinia graminis f. sp. tritici]KAA1126069.1 hypothetical protein PGTUg99_019935 [Puccinia graminis f. sp. tritici]
MKTNDPNPKFLGCLSLSQTQTLYSVILLTISLLTLSNLSSPTTSPSTLLLFHRPSGGAAEEEAEEELLNSRTVLELAIVFLRLLAQSALLSSLISLLGTLFFGRSERLQRPLKIQAIMNMLMSGFGSIVMMTVDFSKNLQSSAAHELCQFALGSDSLASLSRTPDYGLSTQSFSFLFFNWPSPGLLVDENCDERAASLVFPALILLSLCNLFHLHLLHVLFSNPSSQPPSTLASSASNLKSPLLPIHRSSAESHTAPPPHLLPLEKNLIIL